jgi:hypothetical protein
MRLFSQIMLLLITFYLLFTYYFLTFYFLTYYFLTFYFLTFYFPFILTERRLCPEPSADDQGLCPAG